MRTVSPGGSARACRRRSSRRSGGGSADAGSSPACWIRNSSRNRSSSAGTRPERSCPPLASSSIRRSTPPASPSAIRSTTSDSACSGTSPSTRAASSAVIWPCVTVASWSSVPTASRNEPPAARAIRCSAASVRLDLLGVRDPAEHRGELAGAGAPEREALAARAHRRQQLARVGRAEDEHHLVRWLLERLQQRVRRVRRQRVGLVEDVDLATALDRRERCALDHALADRVDAAVRGGVELDHVERAGLVDRHAALAGAVRRRGSARARSSAPWRGSWRARSCRCRAGRRTGRHARRDPARPRPAGCARHVPGPRRRRTCVGGACDRATPSTPSLVGATDPPGPRAVPRPATPARPDRVARATPLSAASFRT